VKDFLLYAFVERDEKVKAFGFKYLEESKEVYFDKILKCPNCFERLIVRDLKKTIQVLTRDTNKTTYYARFYCCFENRCKTTVHKKLDFVDFVNIGIDDIPTVEHRVHLFRGKSQMTASMFDVEDPKVNDHIIDQGYPKILMDDYIGSSLQWTELVDGLWVESSKVLAGVAE